jgi:hypothetical protein
LPPAAGALFAFGFALMFINIPMEAMLMISDVPP